MEEITNDLKTRIADGKFWFDSGEGLEFGGPTLRRRATMLTVKQFLDTDGRVERHGLVFIVNVLDTHKPFKVELNVRVKPSLSEGPLQRSHPYVVVYVLDQRTGREDELFHERFDSTKRYAKLAALSVRDWFVNWIREAFARESKKLFAPESKIP
jgi:hypothetical protein